MCFLIIFIADYKRPRFILSIVNPHVQTLVIIWNYKERTIKSSYEIHKVGIADLCFTCNSQFLVSLGCRDDGNVLVWDIQKNSAICGTCLLLAIDFSVKY